MSLIERRPSISDMKNAWMRVAHRLTAKRVAERHGLRAAHEPLGQRVIARHFFSVALLACRPAHDALAPCVPARGRAQVRNLTLVDDDVAEAVLVERGAALVEAVACGSDPRRENSANRSSASGPRRRSSELTRAHRASNRSGRMSTSHGVTTVSNAPRRNGGRCASASTCTRPARAGDGRRQRAQHRGRRRRGAIGKLVELDASRRASRDPQRSAAAD